MKTFGYHAPTLQGVDFPDPNARLWRYMDFIKFCDLVLRENLFLSRLDLLGDLHEGYVPPPRVLNELSQSRLAELGKTKDEGSDCELNLKLHSLAWAWRFACYVSCWHCSTIESHGMWKAYLGGMPGVAIRTSAAKLGLIAHLAGVTAYLGRVEYVTTYNDPQVFNLGTLAFRKRSHFEDEKEIRLLVQRIDLINSMGQPSLQSEPPGHWPRGIDIPIKEFGFIEEIRISPGAADWFANLVKSLTLKAGISAPVVPSELESKPDWNPT